jgi:hypothetical protein
MPDINRDYDLDDAFKHTNFMPDPAFKESLRGRLQQVRNASSQPTTFSSTGWRRLLFVQTSQHDRVVKHTLQPTTRLIPAFGALILIALIAALIIGVLMSGEPLVGHTPIQPTPAPTSTPAPTPLPAEFDAVDLHEIAGVWSRKDGVTTQMIQFNLDGTAVIDWATQQNGNYVEVVSTSPDSWDTSFAYEFLVWFEDGLLNVQNNGGFHDKRNTPFHAQFEAHVTMDGDTPASLTFIPANADAWLLGPWKDQPWNWVGPIEPEE